MRSALAVLLVAACGPGKHADRSPPPVAPDAAVTTAPPAPLKDPGMRLPRDLRIASYELDLRIDPAKPRFGGTVVMAGTLERATDVVWVHAEAMTIGAATATVGGRELALEVVSGVARGKVALRAGAPMAAGPVSVRMTYEAGMAETETAGTFRQRVGEDWYAFTQHEPISARRSFPCVDEPDVKVPWTVRLTVPVGLVAVGNAPMVREEVDAGWHHVEFAPTEKIPSYLVAYAVGPFEIVDAGKSAGGTPQRILTLRGRQAEAAYAAANVARVTSELERWFGMPHPFPKLDHISIPATTGFGAMENPGLITYRETRLLLPPDASAARKAGFLSLAAHEIAHQWFGNLVTPVWWDDLWLNESFASWLPDRVVRALEPTWRRPEDVMGSREDALSNDSLATARRVRQPITGEGDIVTAFDRITYAKGASVLRLFEQRVGPDRFQAGVRAYLKAHARGNATAADFLAAIDAAAPDAGAGAAMATFLDQAGVPRLSATITCPASGPPGVTLVQSRFVPPGAGAAAPATWRLPVCVRAGTAGATEEVCVTMAETEMVVPLSRCPTWVWPNGGALGYWRSSLAPAGWAALRTQAWKHLSGLERVAVGQDMFAAVSTGEVDVSVALDLVPLLLAEGNRTAIAAAAGLIERLAPWVAAAQRRTFATWVRRQLGARATRLGWLPARTDDVQRHGIRDAVVPLVADVGEDVALSRAAVKLARTWRKLPDAARGDVLAAAVRSQPALVAPLVADFRAERGRAERADLARALGATRDPGQLEAALALVLDPSLDIRDTLPILTGAAEQLENRTLVEGFVAAHLDALMARLPGDTAGSLIGVLAGGCEPPTIARRELVEAKLGKVRGARRRIDQAFERVEQCVARRTVVEPALGRWLAKR